MNFAEPTYTATQILQLSHRFQNVNICTKPLKKSYHRSSNSANNALSGPRKKAALAIPAKKIKSVLNSVGFCKILRHHVLNIYIDQFNTFETKMKIAILLEFGILCIWLEPADVVCKYFGVVRIVLLLGPVQAQPVG